MISVLLLMGMLGSVLSGILPQAAAAGAQKVNLKINTQHCTVYYNEKISGQEWSHQLLKAESDIIRTGMEWPYGIVLFLAPEEGYALSKFMAGNTAGNYYPISDGQEDGTGCTFLSRREHYQGLLKAKYTEEEIKGLVGAAIKMGCHCALLFSREAGFHSDITSTLKFYAEKLPTLEHKIRSVTPAGGGQELPYTEGMGLGVGDVVNYELTAAFYPLENQDTPLAYQDVYVTDQMWGSDGANKAAIEPPTAEEQKAPEGKPRLSPGNTPSPQRIFSGEGCTCRRRYPTSTNRSSAGCGTRLRTPPGPSLRCSPASATNMKARHRAWPCLHRWRSGRPGTMGATTSMRKSRYPSTPCRPTGT